MRDPSPTELNVLYIDLQDIQVSGEGFLELAVVGHVPKSQSVVLQAHTDLVRLGKAVTLFSVLE